MLRLALGLFWAKITRFLFHVEDPRWFRPKILIWEIFLLAAFVVSFAVMPFFDWKFAVILTALVAIHELGHVWAMYRFGMKLKGLFFIPFLGAATVPTESEFPSDLADAWVSLMGPLWGLGSAGVALALWYITGAQAFHMAAFYAIILNIFNLILLFPIDGGRLMRCLTHALPPAYGLAMFLILNVISLAPIIFIVVQAVYVFKVIPFPMWFIVLNIASLAFMLFVVAYGTRTEWRERAAFSWYELTTPEEKQAIMKRGENLEDEVAVKNRESLLFVTAAYEEAENKKIRGRQIAVLIPVYLATVAAFVVLMVVVVKSILP